MEAITQFLYEIASSQLFLLAITIFSFYGSQLIYARYPIILFTPILFSGALIIIFLSLSNIEFEHYYEANEILNFLLGVSVVCLGYLMHKNFNRIKDQKLSILISSFIGSIVGVLSVIGIAHLFGYEEIIILSLEPKSVTMPIALSISESIGGIPAITSLGVVVAGVFGNIVGVSIFKIFRITDPVARGLALGSASHAVGTARATELGALEGAVGGAAIGLMGLFTSFVIPILKSLL